MGLVEVQDLGALLRNKRTLPADLALRLVGQALVGVAAMHRTGTVHGDLTASNLVLTADPDGAVTVEAVGPRAASLADARVEVEAFGVILYLCLSGQDPELLRPLRSVAPWVTPEAAAVVHRALERDRAKRYASANEMLHAVSALCPEGFGVQASEIEALVPKARRDEAAMAEPVLLTVAEAAQVGAGPASTGTGAASRNVPPIVAKRAAGPNAFARFFAAKNEPTRAAWLRAFTAVLAFAAIAYVARLAIFAEALPAPLTAAAPPDVFSSARAHDELVRVAGTNLPRPAGSPEATRVHDVLLARLKELGYAPEEQNVLQCRGGMGCTNVRNVVARTKVPDGTGMVLLVSHYDSVPAGPGAGDDGSGVASALEVARAIKAKAPDAADRSIGFLFDEAEEDGLFGAAAFVDQHPWMKDVRAVVNLDARGTTGNSLLFETIGDSDAVIARASEVLARPWTNSLLATVYSHMPNDTDLTMFRRAGGTVSGANLAFLDGVSRYHTSRDTIDALDPATLQAHGDNALALVRGFASPSFAPAAMSEGTFFDPFHARIVRFDLLATWIMGGLALLLAAIAAVRLPVPASRVLAALGWLLFALIIAGAAVTGVALAAEHTSALPAPIIADPQYILGAMFAIVVATVVGLTDIASRNPHGYARDPERVSAAAWLLFATIGALAAFFAPGTAYLFALPAALASVVRIALPRSTHLPEIFGGALLAVLATPIVLLLYTALGFGLPAALGVPVALFLLPFAPMFNQASRPVAALALLGLLASFAIGLRTPAFSEADPQRIDVVYERDLSQSSSILAIDSTWAGQTQGEPPQAMKNVLGKEAFAGSILPWSPHPVLETRLPLSPSEPPPPKIDSKTEETSSKGTARNVHLHISPSPGARVLSLAVRDTSPLQSAQIDGRDWPQAYLGVGDSRWRVLILRAPPSKGTDVTLTIAGTSPLEARLQSVTSGVPAAAKALVDARPPQAAASQEGDSTIVISPLSI